MRHDPAGPGLGATVVAGYGPAPMAEPTAHLDTYIRDNLPPRELWPEMDYSSLPELAAYPARLNAAVERLRLRPKAIFRHPWTCPPLAHILSTTTGVWEDNSVRKIIAVFATALAILLSTYPATAQGPGKVYRIGFLMSASVATAPAFVKAFRKGLRDLGYVEGRNIRIEWRWAEGRRERLPGLAADLARQKVDIIVCTGAG